MTVQIIRGDARHLPIKDASVDLIVSSPPYWSLRAYQDNGETYDGQIGAEATPGEFVDALVECTREWMRVLKPSGSMWINLGDKYNAYNGNRGEGTIQANGVRQSAPKGNGLDVKDVRPKSLIGIPWRYAIRCIDDLGLILRAEVIWSKPNGLPESVTDRVRRSHEQWFCFEQSGGVEAEAQSFPFCPLCGRPVDARSTLIRRLKESQSSVQPVSVPDEVRPDERGQSPATGGRHCDVTVGASGAAVPPLHEGDFHRGEDAPGLAQDLLAPVVDRDAENGSALPLDEGDGALSVDDPGKPSGVCECIGHPLIIDDEPWLPQSLAAEIMQRVADGEIDPQQAADYLSGDYVRNHSVWFHFTLNPRYYSAVDEIREEYAPSSIPRRTRGREHVYAAPGQERHKGLTDGHNPLGALPGSVWTIPTEPLRVPEELGIDHFAAFPTEWPRRIISGWSPREVCTACGEGRRPVVDRDRQNTRPLVDAHALHGAHDGDDRRGFSRGETTATITGYACACPDASAPTTPGVVLDPFGGTGTTALVADALGRHGISVDMSQDYCRLAEWRTTDPKQQAKAARREFTPAPEQVDGQESLLDLIGEVSP